MEISELSVIGNKAHEEACKKMLDAVHEYFNWRQRNGLHGAVIWVRDSDGRLVVFTRGEYADVIETGIRERDGYLTPDVPFGDNNVE